MPDHLRDKDGYLYEKNWAGQWIEKRGAFGGHERDPQGRSWDHPARGGLLGQQEHSWDGKPLYERRDDDHGGSGSGAGGGLEILLGLLLFVVSIIALAVAAAVIASPLLAPLFLLHAEKQDQRGQPDEAEKWRSRGRTLSLVAAVTVPGIAILAGGGVLAGFMSAAQASEAGLAAFLAGLLGIAAAPVCAALCLLLGLRPTATVYLRQPPAQSRQVFLDRVLRPYFEWILKTGDRIVQQMKGKLAGGLTAASAYQRPSSGIAPSQPLPAAPTPAQSPRALLIGVDGRRYVVTKDNFVIGRSASSDLHIPEPQVSRTHARLCYAAGAWFIQDQGSRFGTYVNGVQQQAVRLKRGDRIQIGSREFIFDG